MNITKHYTAAIAIIAFVFTAFLVLTNNSQAEVFSNSCTVSTSTARSVGHQESSQILATSSNRAWAIIQVKTNETNIVSLSFGNGASAVVNQGMTLGTSTEDTNEITFGRNTELPYTGAVAGITNTSSTTVLVTECNY